ncbi:MAG: SIR2 family protein [Gemmatimonadota bacterium]|nr:SIR2 family protein [Gemmatimonadota bacterium]
MIPAEAMQAFSETLLTGGYNLLLGSGVSLDSCNGLGKPLKSSESLRQELCKLTGVRTETSLTRVYALLSREQRQSALVEPFSNCQPGPSLKYLSPFLWRRLFTFNVDDAIEAHYEAATGRKQTLVPLNFDAPFEPSSSRSELLAVHLHGWVREPEAGFVFSASEYTRVMHTLNPWMHLLAEILSTEPFIIAGTSLNEIDLEYYLSQRSPATPRRGRGPSFLIEPSPDAATKSDCARYGLILVKARFGEFLAWLRERFPAPPTLADLIVPDVSALFSGVEPAQLLRFFSDFELVPAADQPLSKVPSPFLYGRAPDWSDLHQHVDIDRSDNSRLVSLISPAEPAGTSPNLVVVLGEPGAGKTTAIKRVAHSLALTGKPVLSVRALSRIDTEAAIACLGKAATDLVLLVDGFADHVDQIDELLDNSAVSSRVKVLSAERVYRRDFLDVVLGDRIRTTMAMSSFRISECEQLIERYRQYGLVAEPKAIKHPQEFAKRLEGDPPAIAVCRILNDFKPLDLIIESLWTASGSDNQLAYTIVALAQHCYFAGVRYSILQANLGQGIPIAQFLEENAPLRLATHLYENEYLTVMNALVGDRILFGPAKAHSAVLLEAFRRLAMMIAPYVNRKAIMRRSPEARLAGRLFDGDKIVRPLLGPATETFYIAVQKEWEWNSRYWEQRALLAADNDLAGALQYGRHAVAIEPHPFPLTTLGKLLFMEMESRVGNRDTAFAEGFDRLLDAIALEARRSRTTIHPYNTLISGASRYLELGGKLTYQQRERLSEVVSDAGDLFEGDPMIDGALARLDRWLPQ